MLKIGLVLDSALVPQVLLDFVQRCEREQVAQVCQILVVGKQTSQRKALSLLGTLEKSLIRGTRYTDTVRLLDVGRLNIPVSELGAMVQADTSQPEDVDFFLDFRADVQLDLSLQGQSQRGVLKLVDAENRGILSPEAGFWEVYDQAPITRFSILHAGPADQVGQRLWSGSATTGVHYLLNHLVLTRKALMGLFYCLKRIAQAADLKGFCLEPIPNAKTRPVTWRAQTRYLAKMAVFLTSLLGRHILLQKRYRWAVGFSKTGWDQFDPAHSLQIPNPPYRFNADPFVIREKDCDYCLVETLDYRKGKGVIAAYAIHDTEVEDLGIVLEEPFHLSYPYLFRYNGRIYLCPESSAKQEIRIYEAVDFPRKWKLVQIAMQQVSAVDSLIFEQGGKWWLLTNIDTADAGDHASELHVFYADQPITDQWHPHPANPVLFDASKARNGGAIFTRDQIYRVAQCGGFFRYGTGVTIQHIDLLSEDDYHETCVQTIYPQDLQLAGNVKIPVGNHHLHGSGYWVVFDYCHLQKPNQARKSTRLDQQA